MEQNGNLIAVTALFLTSCLHCCQQRMFNHNTNYFICLESEFYLLPYLKFSFKSVNFSNSYARKQKWVYLGLLNTLQSSVPNVGFSTIGGDIFRDLQMGHQQVALLSQRGRPMLHVCQQLASTVQNVEQSLLLLVTQATDLSLRAVKCAVLLSLA